MTLDKFFNIIEKARGNWGHEGRPGKRGGSLPKSGGGSVTGLQIPSSIKGNLIEKMRKGLPAPKVGELKVGSWDASAGYRQKAKTYSIITMDGQASSTSKEDLKTFAKNIGMDLSDKTYNK